MVRTGIVLPDETAGLDTEATVDVARAAEAAGVDSLWKGEISGSNALMLLSAVATATEEIGLGTGVVNVYSRAPTLLGTSAATLDRLSDGRAMLGVGVSSPVMVEQWHCGSFERPLRRMRESIEIVRQVVAGGTVDYDGEVFDVGPYTSQVAAVDGEIPIFNAAMGETNRRLTGEFADGWMPVLTPLSALESLAEDVAEAARAADREPPTAAPWVPVAVADDPARAEELARDHLAQEMAMGYNRLAAKFGYGEAADEAFEAWRAGDREAAAAAITGEMLDDLAVYGTREAVRERLGAYADAGADLLVAWPSFTATREEIDAVVETMGAL
ncbi:MAG: LLM class flavin-dependent oxidoreductase [Haloarculaceae archaeon]